MLQFMVAVWAAAAIDAPATAVSAPPANWARRYQVGSTLQYRMDATNQGRRYSVTAEATITRNEAGVEVERLAWSDLRTDRGASALSARSLAFRQTVSLAPGYVNAVPPLAELDPGLIGPVTDMLTFYSDLWLADRMIPQFRRPGDHVAFPFGRPVSWADGTTVIVGEDAIDFDVTLAAVDAAAKTATIVVRHVPPSSGGIRLAAEWMRAAVTRYANNWEEVQRRPDGSYAAQVGAETFEDTLTVDLEDGKILSASLVNPVEAVERICSDQALRTCSAAKPLHIVRNVSIKLVRT